MWLLINRARAEPDGSTTQKREQHYPNLGQELSGHRTWLISNCLPPALALVAVLPCVPRLNNKTVSDQRSFWRTRSDSDPGIPISARLEEKKKNTFLSLAWMTVRFCERTALEIFCFGVSTLPQGHCLPPANTRTLFPLATV